MKKTGQIISEEIVCVRAHRVKKVGVYSEDTSDVTNTVTQFLWLAKSDQNKRND